MSVNRLANIMNMIFLSHLHLVINNAGTFKHLLTCRTTILPFPTCSHTDVRIARLLTVHIRSPRCLSIH